MKKIVELEMMKIKITGTCGDETESCEFLAWASYAFTHSAFKIHAFTIHTP